jgi:hypothetical protein
MSDGGKGSAPRPMQVSRDKYSSNWDAIFKKEKQTDNYQDFLTTEDCVLSALEKLNNSEKNIDSDEKKL